VDRREMRDTASVQSRRQRDKRNKTRGVPGLYPVLILMRLSTPLLRRVLQFRAVSIYHPPRLYHPPLRTSGRLFFPVLRTANLPGRVFATPGRGI